MDGKRKNKAIGNNIFYQTQKNKYPQLKILSMGMTGDYMVAIEEGATHVRVGTGIFGTRNYAI